MTQLDNIEMSDVAPSRRTLGERLEQGRGRVMAVVADPHTERALRAGLAGMIGGELECRRGSTDTAISLFRKTPSPHVLIVDIDDDQQPLPGLRALAEVIEPDTIVLVAGRTSELGLYRELTRGLGAMEYLAKPLTRDLVDRYFAPFVRGELPSSGVREGRLVVVTGAGGGVGTSVVTAALAWHCGVVAHRHTVLLDADLHRATAALLMNSEPADGLALALETPDRIDKLLAERAAAEICGRLHLLATALPLDREVVYSSGAADQLLAALRQRYNQVIADVPWRQEPFCRELLWAAQHVVVVLTPTLPSVHQALRILSTSTLNQGKAAATLVLNRASERGGLPRIQVESALKRPVDVVIPDLPHTISGAVRLGDPAALDRGQFGAAIRALAQQAGVSSVARPPTRAIRLRLPWRRH